MIVAWSHLTSKSWTSSFCKSHTEQVCESLYCFVSSGCTEILVDHVSNLSSSKESVGILSSLLFEAHSFLEVWLRVDELLQGWRNHRIKHVEIKKIMMSCNRSRCNEFVNWFWYFNFFFPQHSDLRFGCSPTNFSSEIKLPALKFHRDKKCPKISLSDRNSRIIHHTKVRIGSTNMIQHTTSSMIYNFTSSLEVGWMCVFNDSLFVSLFSLLSQKYQVSYLEMKMPKFFELLKIVEDCLFWAGGRSKNVSQKTCTILCISRQSRIASRQSPGNQNRRSLIRNVGRLQSCSLIQGRRILSCLTRNSLCYVNPEFEPSFDSRSQDSFCFCIRQFFAFLACLTRSVSLQQILLNSSISWQSLAWFSWQSLFLNSNSPYKLILSLSEPDLPIGLLGEAEIAATQNSWLISWKEWSRFRFSQFFASISASAWNHFLLSLVLFLELPSQLSVQGSCGDYLCLSIVIVTTFLSRSLFPLDRELASVVATDFRSNSTPVSRRLERLDTWRTPVSRELVWPNKNETLLAAALRLLLNASGFGIPLALLEIMVTSSEHWKSGLLSGMSIGLCSGSG